MDESYGDESFTAEGGAEEPAVEHAVDLETLKLAEPGTEPTKPAEEAGKPAALDDSKSVVAAKLTPENDDAAADDDDEYDSEDEDAFDGGQDFDWSLKALEKVPIFRKFPLDMRRILAGEMRADSKRNAGDVVCERNSKSSRMWFIKRGTVEVLGPDDESVDPPILLKAVDGRTDEPQGYFGEIGAISGGKRTASCRVHSKSAELWVLESRKIWALAKKDYASRSQLLSWQDKDVWLGGTLRRIPIFKQCDDHILHKLTASMTVEKKKPGEYVCRYGEKSTEMYILQSGEVEVVPLNSAHAVARLQPGDFFGEIGMLTRGKRTADIKVCSASYIAGGASVFVMKAKVLFEVLKEHPKLQHSMRRVALERLRRDEEQGMIKTVSSKTAKERQNGPKDMIRELIMKKARALGKTKTANSYHDNLAILGGDKEVPTTADQITRQASGRLTAVAMKWQLAKGGITKTISQGNMSDLAVGMRRLSKQRRRSSLSGVNVPTASIVRTEEVQKGTVEYKYALACEKLMEGCHQSEKNRNQIVAMRLFEEAYASLSNLEADAAILTEEEGTFTAIAGEVATVKASCLLNIAQMKVENGEYERCIAYCESGLDDINRLHRLPHDQYFIKLFTATAHYMRGKCYHRWHKLQQKLAEKEIEFAEAKEGLNVIEEAMSLSTRTNEGGSNFSNVSDSPHATINDSPHHRALRLKTTRLAKRQNQAEQQGKEGTINQELMDLEKDVALLRKDYESSTVGKLEAEVLELRTKLELQMYRPDGLQIGVDKVGKLRDEMAGFFRRGVGAHKMKVKQASLRDQKSINQEKVDRLKPRGGRDESSLPPEQEISLACARKDVFRVSKAIETAARDYEREKLGEEDVREMRERVEELWTEFDGKRKELNKRAEDLKEANDFSHYLSGKWVEEPQTFGNRRAPVDELMANATVCYNLNAMDHDGSIHGRAMNIKEGGENKWEEKFVFEGTLNSHTEGACQFPGSSSSSPLKAGSKLFGGRLSAPALAGDATFVLNTVHKQIVWTCKGSGKRVKWAKVAAPSREEEVTSGSKIEKIEREAAKSISQLQEIEKLKEQVGLLEQIATATAPPASVMSTGGGSKMSFGDVFAAKKMGNMLGGLAKKARGVPDMSLMDQYANATTNAIDTTNQREDLLTLSEGEYRQALRADPLHKRAKQSLVVVQKKLQRRVVANMAIPAQEQQVLRDVGAARHGRLKENTEGKVVDENGKPVKMAGGRKLREKIWGADRGSLVAGPQQDKPNERTLGSFDDVANCKFAFKRASFEKNKRLYDACQYDFMEVGGDLHKPRTQEQFVKMQEQDGKKRKWALEDARLEEERAVLQARDPNLYNPDMKKVRSKWGQLNRRDGTTMGDRFLARVEKQSSEHSARRKALDHYYYERAKGNATDAEHPRESCRDTTHLEGQDDNGAWWKEYNARVKLQLAHYDKTRQSKTSSVKGLRERVHAQRAGMHGGGTATLLTQDKSFVERMEEDQKRRAVRMDELREEHEARLLNQGRAEDDASEDDDSEDKWQGVKKMTRRPLAARLNKLATVFLDVTGKEPVAQSAARESRKRRTASVEQLRAALEAANKQVGEGLKLSRVDIEKLLWAADTKCGGSGRIAKAVFNSEVLHMFGPRSWGKMKGIKKHAAVGGTFSAAGALSPAKGSRGRADESSQWALGLSMGSTSMGNSFDSMGRTQREVALDDGCSGGLDPKVELRLQRGEKITYRLQVVYLPPRNNKGRSKPPTEVPESVWGGVQLPAHTTVAALRALLQQHGDKFGYPTGEEVYVHSDTHAASRLSDDCVLADRLIRKKRNTAMLYVRPPPP
jgi:CRP-like cAMP-binding protein